MGLGRAGKGQVLRYGRSWNGAEAGMWPSLRYSRAVLHAQWLKWFRAVFGWSGKG